MLVICFYLRVRPKNLIGSYKLVSAACRFEVIRWPPPPPCNRCLYLQVFFPHSGQFSQLNLHIDCPGDTSVMSVVWEPEVGQGEAGCLIV